MNALQSCEQTMFRERNVNMIIINKAEPDNLMQKQRIPITKGQ